MYSPAPVAPSTTTPHTENRALPPLLRLAWADARKLLKPYRGYEEFVGPLIAIVEKFAAELGTGGLDVDRLRTAPAAIKALEAERDEVAERLAYLDSTLYVEKSQLWTAMLNIYARAKSLARTNRSVRGDIEPFMFFMKTGKRKKPAP